MRSLVHSETSNETDQSIDVVDVNLHVDIEQNGENNSNTNTRNEDNNNTDNDNKSPYIPLMVTNTEPPITNGAIITECLSPISNGDASSTQDNNDDCAIPFDMLDGETLVAMTHATKQLLIILTNYRICLHTTDLSHHVPLGLIESVITRESVSFQIWRKDGQSHQVNFDTSDLCMIWASHLISAIENPSELNSMVAFQYFKCGKPHPIYATQPYFRYDFKEEVTRLGFDLQSTWRISRANFHYDLCSSYPQQLLVPACISDEKLLKVFKFRSSRRIPVVVWRHRSNGSVIARCSQPEVGLFFWREPEDEALLGAISDACAIDTGPIMDTCSVHDGSDESSSVGDGEIVARYNVKKRLLIIDARSYTIAYANRTRGGGLEYPDYYPTCDVIYMNLVNIHRVRKSFQALRSLCSASSKAAHNWFNQLDNTGWFLYISGLIQSASKLVIAVEFEQRPVLVHCSDGWDRTAQIVSLGQLLLDPFYRTLIGFQILIEREWITFGHKFADRCGQGLTSSDINERSPIFIQWLDCVYQLLVQFPCDFQFNVLYLVKLAQHTYSNLFGSFLCNTQREFQNHCLQKTYSVWQFLNTDDRFVNKLYKEPPSFDDSHKHVLIPSSSLRDLRLWRDLYLGGLEPELRKPSVLVPNDTDCSSTSTITTTTTHTNNTTKADKTTNCTGTSAVLARARRGSVLSQTASVTSSLTKTRSCDNLLNDDADDVDLAPSVRRLSDPNLVNVDELKLSNLIPNDDGSLNNPVNPNDVVDSNQCDFSDILNDTNCQNLNVPSLSSNNLLENRSVSFENSDQQCDFVYCNTNKVFDENNESNLETGVDCEICLQTRNVLTNKTKINNNDEYFDENELDSSRSFTKPNLGIDGLSVLDCTIQTRVQQLLDNDQKKINNLKAEIDNLHQILMRQLNHNCSRRCINQNKINTSNSEENISEAESANEFDNNYQENQVPNITEQEVMPSTSYEVDNDNTRCNHCRSLLLIGKKKVICEICNRLFCMNCDAKNISTNQLSTAHNSVVRSSTPIGLFPSFNIIRKYQSSSSSICSICSYRLKMAAPATNELGHGRCDSEDNSSRNRSAEQVTASSNWGFLFSLFSRRS